MFDSKKTSMLYNMLLLANILSLFIIANTTHDGLIFNDSGVVYLYRITPLLLIFLHAYFLQGFLEDKGTIGWIHRYLGWGLTPFTLFFYYARFLTRQDAFTSMFQLALFIFSVVIAYRFNKKRKHEIPRAPIIKICLTALTFLMIYITLFLGWAAFCSDISRLHQKVPFDKNLKWLTLGYNIPTNYLNIDLAEKGRFVKPDGFDIHKENKLEKFKGAKLTCRSFRYAIAHQLFLVKAELQYVNFEGAFIGDSDMQWANMEKANLKNSNYGDTRFISANLTEANMENSSGVGANFTGAKLINANLKGAHLFNADFDGALLEGADIQWAQFHNSKNLSAEELRKTKNYRKAFYDKEIRQRLEISDAELRRELKRYTDWRYHSESEEESNDYLQEYLQLYTNPYAP